MFIMFTPVGGSNTTMINLNSSVELVIEDSYDGYRTPQTSYLIAKVPTYYADEQYCLGYSQEDEQLEKLMEDICAAIANGVKAAKIVYFGEGVYGVEYILNNEESLLSEVDSHE